MVPVPSRLHYGRTQEKPLSGIRVTIKDVVDLKGVKTTGQSRAYAEMYGAREANAAIVSRLIDMGAVIIGKTKCTQFASSDQPTADWVDYRCPWNPRGDGYLSPRGSSTGTCVALAGYDWVDIGIGTDSKFPQNQLSRIVGLILESWREHPRPSRRDGAVRHKTDSSCRAYGRDTADYQVVMSLEALGLDAWLNSLRGIDTPGIVCRNATLLHELSVRLCYKQNLALKAVSASQHNCGLLRERPTTCTLTNCSC